MRKGIGAIAIAAFVVVAGVAALRADTLILRDGRRVEGQLLSVQRNGMIEFREDRGFRASRTIQVRRDEVDRIEFDDRGGNFESNRDLEDRRPPGAGMGTGRPRPNGLRERDVWTDARKEWTDSGLDVRDGQVLYFDTHGGDIQWRRGSHTTAAGDPSSTPNSRRPMPNRAIGALIGRVGNSSDYFFIGDDDGPVRVRGNGRLFLGINDDNVTDNSGAFRVTVFF